MLARVSRPRGAGANAFSSVPVVVDGEIVSLDAQGRSAFQRLQESQKKTAGSNLRGVRSALRRRARLRAHTARRAQSPARTAHRRRDARALLQTRRRQRQSALRARAKAAASKASSARSARSPYQERRSRGLGEDQGAATSKSSSSAAGPSRRAAGNGFGALLLGAYHKTARFVTSVRSAPASPRSCLRDLHARLRALERKTSPFSNDGGRAERAGALGQAGARRRGALYRVDARLAPAPARPISGCGPTNRRRPYVELPSTPEARLMRARTRSVTRRTRSRSRSRISTKCSGRATATPRAISSPTTAASRRASMPHLRDRPLTLQRYPDGIDGVVVFRKAAAQGRAGLGRPRDGVDVRRRATPMTYVVCNDEATWRTLRTSRRSCCTSGLRARRRSTSRTSYSSISIRARACTLKTLATVALRAARRCSAAIGLQPLVKTTGGYGLHVVVPLDRRLLVRDGEDLCRTARAPHRRANSGERRTLERRSANAIAAAVYLDYVQVGARQDDVAPYSVRARDGAPVSTPLQWSEVEAFARRRGRRCRRKRSRPSPSVRPAKRLQRNGDLWGRRRVEEAAAREPPIAKAQTRSGLGRDIGTAFG